MPDKPLPKVHQWVLKKAFERSGMPKELSGIVAGCFEVGEEGRALNLRKFREAMSDITVAEKALEYFSSRSLLGILAASGAGKFEEILTSKKNKQPDLPPPVLSC